VLFIAGNLKQWIGHLVFAGIYDASGNQVASVADDEYGHIGVVDNLMADSDHRLSADRDSPYKNQVDQRNPACTYRCPALRQQR